VSETRLLLEVSRYIAVRPKASIGWLNVPHLDRTLSSIVYFTMTLNFDLLTQKSKAFIGDPTCINAVSLVKIRPVLLEGAQRVHISAKWIFLQLFYLFITVRLLIA